MVIVLLNVSMETLECLFRHIWKWKKMFRFSSVLPPTMSHSLQVQTVLWSPLAESSALSLLLLVVVLSCDWLTVLWFFLHLRVEVFQGHHPGHKSVAQHGSHGHNHWQELLHALVGDVVQISAFRLWCHSGSSALCRKERWEMRSCLRSQFLCGTVWSQFMSKGVSWASGLPLMLHMFLKLQSSSSGIYIRKKTTDCSPINTCLKHM